MRLFLLAMLISVVATPVLAQGKRDTMPGAKAPPKEDLAKKRADEEAYQRALKIIPESKVKVDPWQGAR